MRTLFLVVIAVLFCLPTLAQVNISLLKSHVDRIEKIQSPIKKLRKYRSFYRKDSLRYFRQQARQLKRKDDSLLHSFASTSIEKNLQRNNQGTSIRTLNDKSHPLQLTTKSDSSLLHSVVAERRDGELSDFKEREYAQKSKTIEKTISNFGNGTDSSKVRAMLDAKSLESYASRYSGAGELKKYQNQLDELKTMNQSYLTTAEQLHDTTFLKHEAKRKAEEYALHYLQSQRVLITNIQKKMALLMKKYSIVPNSNDLSSAVKRNSLKGHPFLERLFINPGFQLVKMQPVIVDLSLGLGYRFNKRLTTGAGFGIRETVGDTVPRLSADVVAVKAFLVYDVLNSYFLQVESARNGAVHHFAVADGSSVKRYVWTNSILLGVGKKIPIHSKINMTVTLFYNPIRKPNDNIYPRSLNFRVGFQFSDTAFLRRTK